MHKRFFSVALITSIIVFITGCTSWNGISQTDKPGTYYVVTNTSRFMGGIRPGALLCTSDPETGDLKCKQIQVEQVWDEEE